MDTKFICNICGTHFYLSNFLEDEEICCPNCKSSEFVEDCSDYDYDDF